MTETKPTKKFQIPKKWRAVKSVKFQLTLWHAFILTILLSAFSFFMYTEFSRAVHRDVDQSLEFDAISVEDAISGFVDKMFKARMKSGKSVDEISEELKPKIRLSVIKVLEDWKRFGRSVTRSTLMIRLIDLDKSVLASNLKGWEREIIFPDYERDRIFMESGESFQTIHFENKPIRLYYRIVGIHDRPLFVIQCGQPIYEVEETLGRLGFIILISIPGTVLAACLAGWFLARRSFRQIDHMIREARQITAAYLQERLSRTYTGDEVDRLAETLNEMMNRIESSTRAIQDFSSDISHELKTPLAIIRGEIDLAFRRERSTESLKQTLRTIDEEVDELIQLVNNLMLLVKSDAKQLQFEKQQINLRQILELIVERFKERAQSKEIELSASLDTDGVMLGDPLYVKRLFFNLVDNAIKFTDKDGHVRVNLFPREDELVAEVIDDGPGLESETQEKVFSRFFRTDQARSMEGSGLGLNIAKAICDGHGGTIEISSQLGKGTTVRVIFTALH